MLSAGELFFLAIGLTLVVVAYNSSTERNTKEEISSALRSGSEVIGLYGNKGSGKSALVRSELKRYKTRFGKVLYYQLRNNQDVNNLRDRIANNLNVHFTRHRSSAHRIPMQRNSQLTYVGGPTLVILDDFPNTFRLRALRILYRNERGTGHLREHCKVLLTARNKSDCKSMGCDDFIRMKPLTKDEAIEMIKDIIDLNDESPYSKVAQQIAPECIGSPRLITDVVFSLKNKPIKNWKETLVSLKHSTACYQIFLNFRGSNTRDQLARPLYKALCSKGFETFMDEESLQNGEDIKELLNKIEESRCAIVILSEDYADSEWCLKELVKILNCRKGKNKQLVLPIFYKVNPSDIRNLKGKYSRAMAKHKNKPEYSEWELALKKITKVKGEPYKSPKGQFIKKLVDIVYGQRHRLHIQCMYER